MPIDRRYALIGHEHAGAGVTDHGALTGLSDNDHPQYGLLDKGSGQSWEQYQTFNDGISIGYGYADIWNTGATQVALWMYNESWAANEKFWGFDTTADGKTFSWSMFGDSPTYTQKNLISATRSGNAATIINYGNETDFPDHQFHGSVFAAMGAHYVQLLCDDVNNFVGIGAYSDNTAYFDCAAFGKAAAAATEDQMLYLGHYRGTYSAPSVHQAGDDTGQLGFYGKPNAGASPYAFTGVIKGYVESVGAGVLGGGIKFLTHPGTGNYFTGLVERMYLKGDGDIALGTDAFISFDEHSSAPATPSSGRVALYAKADGKMYFKDDAGTETACGGGGAVATDAIWDAKGDLAVGTGANTASKLTAGTNGYVLMADSAEATGLKWAPISGGSDPVFVCSYQTADQTLTSTIVETDGTGMKVTLTPGTWQFEIVAFTASHATPDMRVRLHFTGTAAHTRYWGQSTISSGSTVYGTAQYTAFDAAGDLTTSTNNGTTYFGTVEVTATGVLSFQFRQVSSSATGVTLHQGSYIKATRLINQSPHYPAPLGHSGI